MISFDSERCLENFLVKEKEFLREEFFVSESAQIYQQLDLGPYGITDIVCIDYQDSSFGYNDVCVDIIELKNTPLSHDHVAQVARYYDFFRRLGEVTGDVYEINAYLVGKKTFPISNDLCFLCQNIDWLTVREFSIDPRKGIVFKDITGWTRSNYDDDFAHQFHSTIVPVKAKAPPKKEPGKGFDFDLIVGGANG